MLRALGPELLGVEFPTEAGWLCLTVPAETEGMKSAWGLDLSLLLRVLKASSWPRTGLVGEVELMKRKTDLAVAVPTWRQARSRWVSGEPALFSFPLAQGVWFDPEALPAAPEAIAGEGVCLETDSVVAALNGAASCVDGRQDRGVLQCVELVCRPDELLGMATDGGVIGLSSEPAAIAVEGEMSVPLPPIATRVALAIWSKLQLQGDLALRLSEERLELSPVEGGQERFRVVLRLHKGHVPLDLLERLPKETQVAMGRVDAREALLRPLELAELNPEAKVAWLVWEQGALTVCSHGPLMDLREEVALATPSSESQSEIALDNKRLRTALDQLKAAGGTGAISLYLDSAQRPQRLMLRQSNPATGQVRQVLVMGTAGVGYEVFRARAEELQEQVAEASAKERRRQSYRTPIPA